MRIEVDVAEDERTRTRDASSAAWPEAAQILAWHGYEVTASQL